MRRWLMMLAFWTVAAAAPAMAAGGPGTPQFAAPTRGSVAIVPGGQGSSEFAPIATGQRVFTVYARLRVRPRGGQARLFMRYKRANQRCARTYRKDRGRAIRLGLASVDAAGFVTARSPEIAWNRTGKVRFCVWLPPVRRVVPPPRTSVVTFFARALGIHMYGQPRTIGTGTQIVYTILSTHPITVETPDPCGQFRTQSFALDKLEPAGFVYLYGASGADTRRCPTDGEQLDVTGGFTMSVALTNEQAAAGGMVHRGACVLTNFNTSVSLERARVIVESQGCRVGRILSARTGRPARGGQVTSFAMNGAKAWFAPQGSRVDLVVG
ncbi:MAG: hypothetical protein R2878_04870 [Thermoleophilia bacterium]